jgi:N-acetylmuramoyl-L-alanine amidase
MIVLAKGLSLTSAAEATKSFNDIPNNHWASAFIAVSSSAGIMRGYPDGSFRPNDKITRAELARMLRRSITVKQISAVKPTYKDVPRTYWAFNEVETVAHYEIMGGYKDGKFHPVDPATRAQTATAIFKIVRDSLTDVDANTQEATQTPQNNDSTATPPADDGKIIICIDAGHGGKDPGAIAKSNGLKEKDVNLSVALKLQSLLVSKVDGVVMTRATDEFVDLSKRAQIANEARADIFISIHHNSSSTDTASGTAVYSFPGSDAGAELAELIQEELVKAFGWADIAGKNDGARTANYAVLRQTAMTAALCESAYMSNPEEAGLLATNAFQQQEAGAIANGILNYLGNNN